MRRSHGFTLIELLIVVAVVGIISAIALPAVTRARIAANEAGAIASMRAISSSEANYAATCGSGGYATDLADLAKPASGSTQGFISPDLGENFIDKSGYTFAVVRNASPDTDDVVVPSCNDAVQDRATGFFASADPQIHGQSGIRYFATDTPGTIYFDADATMANPIPSDARTVQQ